MALLTIDMWLGVSQSTALRQAALQTLASVWRNRSVDVACPMRVQGEVWHF
jgi:hypothetical protein